MRDDQTIEREIETARVDLEARLNQLRLVIQEKLAFGRHTRQAIERRLTARPLASVGIAFGLGALTALARPR